MKKAFLGLLLGLGLIAGAATINAQTVPSVSAGASQAITLPTNSVSLSGTAASANGTISTYAWTKVSGGAANITTPAAQNTTVTDLVQGVYVFRLTATDTTSASATADVTVTVNPAPSLAPVVSAGVAQTIVLPTSVVSLTGTTTASSGRTIASQVWSQTSGPIAASIATPTALTTQVTGLTTTGTYVFTLTATDSAASTGTATVAVTVQTAGTPTPAPQKAKMQLEINPNGKVNLQGTILANNAGVLSVQIWGITFTINTTNARFNGEANKAATFVVGDTIRVNGVMDKNATTPTVNAKIVRNVTANARMEQERKEREDDKKKDDDRGRGESEKENRGRSEKEDRGRDR